MLRRHTRMPEPRREAPFEPVRDKRICIPRPGNNLLVPGLSRNYPCRSTHQCLRDFRECRRQLTPDPVSALGCPLVVRCQLPLTAGTLGASDRHTPLSRKPNLQSDFKRRCVYPNASWASSGDGLGTGCPLDEEGGRLPAGTAVEIATTAGSIRITVYPATAPAPKPGAKIRVGSLMTPSQTASWMASGMLAEEALPTVSTLK